MPERRGPARLDGRKDKEKANEAIYAEVLRPTYTGRFCAQPLSADRVYLTHTWSLISHLGEGATYSNSEWMRDLLIFRSSRRTSRTRTHSAVDEANKRQESVTGSEKAVSPLAFNPQTGAEPHYSLTAYVDPHARPMRNRTTL